MAIRVIYLTRKNKFFLFLASLFLLVTLVSQAAIKQQEKSQPVVSATQLKDKNLFFYRDDCDACRDVYPTLYWHRLFHQDTEMINLNQEKNRHYIKEYGIQSVPWLIKKTTVYSGNDVKKIKKILHH